MKKVIIASLTLMISLGIFTGCFNYKDINKILFITGIIVDIDEEKQPVVYIEAFKGVEGTESGERIIFRGRGKTVFEAVRNVNLGTSFKLNGTQNKVVIFTTKAAEYGLDKFIDLFQRDQELLVRQQICIYSGEIENLVNIKIKENKYIGQFIERLLYNIGASSRAVRLTINQYYNQRLIGDRANVFPLIEVKQDVGGDKKILINGLAVVKDDKMISIIPREMGQGFNFLFSSIKSGTLEITNPNFPQEFITLEILKSKTNTEIKYENNKIKLIKKINVNTVIAEVQKGLYINKETIEEIQEIAESNIKKACYQIFYEYKEKGVDIFDIKEELERNYPKVKVDNVIKNTELFVEVNVKIESANDDLDFINVKEKG